MRLDAFREALRKKLPERLVPWFATVLEREGYSADEARSRAAEIKFAFEPGDIVSEVMSFGSPTPIEIVVASPNLDDARGPAQQIAEEFRKIPQFRDVQIQQTLDYPTVPISSIARKRG